MIQYKYIQHHLYLPQKMLFVFPLMYIIPVIHIWKLIKQTKTISFRLVPSTFHQLLIIILPMNHEIIWSLGFHRAWQSIFAPFYLKKSGSWRSHTHTHPQAFIKNIRTNTKTMGDLHLTKIWSERTMLREDDKHKK